MASLPTKPSTPRVCILSADMSPLESESSTKSYILAIQSALNTFGDFLALHSFKSLVSLVSLGATNLTCNLIDISGLFGLFQNLFQLGKLNIIQWRHSVAKLEAEKIKVSEKAWIDFFDSVRHAKDTLARIPSWTLVIFVPTSPTYLLQEATFRSLAALDQIGIKTRFVHFSPLPTLHSDITEGKISEGTGINTWAQLEVLFKTSLCNSKFHRFSALQLPCLELFIKRLVGKLVENSTAYHKTLALQLSDSFCIRMRVRNLFHDLPTLRPASHLPTPSQQTECDSSGVLIGRNGLIKGVSEAQIPHFNKVVLQPILRVPTSPTMQYISVCVPVSLEPWMNPSNDPWSPQQPTSSDRTFIPPPPSPHRLKTTSKGAMRANKDRFAKLALDLREKNETLLVWTMWDLERLVIDGPAAQNLIRRHYLLGVSSNGMLTATGVVNAQQQLGPVPVLSYDDLRQRLTDSSEEDYLENLELKVLLESIPSEAIGVENIESHFHDVLDAFVWSSTTSTSHHMQ